MLPEFTYAAAGSVAEALALLAEHGASARILAGGTDLLVDLRERRAGPATLIDIRGASELQGIVVAERSIQIGAGTLIREVLDDPTVTSELPALATACRRFADLLTRNMATIGGNVANASPGADLAVPLVALGASVELVSTRGERILPIDQFLVGPRQTARLSGELLTTILIPRRAWRGQWYDKLGLKHGGAIAVVSVAVLLDGAGRRPSDARIALGAVAPRPFRALAAERMLAGALSSPELAERAAEAAAEACRPISDIRGSLEYRRAMARSLVRRGIDEAWTQIRTLRGAT